jgi:isopropylmalate/homocitrate/citramalate synthase
MESKGWLLKEERFAWQPPRGDRRDVQHVDKPDLIRDLYPYSEVPRITFDFVELPPDPPEEIWITDTTFRDGQQARPPYTVQQIVDLYDMLHRLGGPNGVIRKAEFFIYSEKDREAVEKCRARGYQAPEVTGWIRAVPADFKLVKEMGLKETGILTSSSDYHTFLKLGKDREKAMLGYLDLVRAAFESGLECVRCHLEDLTRADIYGFIVPYVQRLMAIAREYERPVWIRLCDTMGYGVPYPGAALPRSVPKLVQVLIRECGVPKDWLEWHGHNDFHKVLANGVVAWLYGCANLNCTLMGFGERCGNPPLEGAVMEYIGLKGTTNGLDPTVITEIAAYLQKECGMPVAANYPFVGANFNVTMAGIHADGLIKDEEIYNIFDTAKILGRPMAVNVTDKSGAAGVAFWVNERLGLKGEARLPKTHPGILKIVEWVEAQYAARRTTAISNEEMMEQVKTHLAESF